MATRGVLIGVGLISLSIAFVAETRNAPDVIAVAPTTALLEAPVIDQTSDYVHPEDMPQRFLSSPIRCQQWIAQWGPGEIARQRCVDADLSKRLPGDA